MVRFFCPGCWKDFSEDIAQCPYCDLNIHEFWDSKDWIEKLILALHHSEPNTRFRAVFLLGRAKDARAVNPLIALIKETREVYLAREAVKALGEIGSADAVEFLRTLINHPANMVKAEVQTILGAIDGKDSGSRISSEAIQPSSEGGTKCPTRF
jgi:hypothetical protein